MTISQTKETSFQDLVTKADRLKLPPIQLVDLFNYVAPPSKAELITLLEERDLPGKWAIYHALKKTKSGRTDSEHSLDVVLWHIEAAIERAYLATDDTKELESLEKACDSSFTVLHKIREKIGSESRRQVPLADPARLQEMIFLGYRRKDSQLQDLVKKELDRRAKDLIPTKKSVAELEQIMAWPITEETKTAAHTAAVVICDDEEGLTRLGDYRKLDRIAWMHPLTKLVLQTASEATLRAIIDDPFDEGPQDKYTPRTKAMDKLMESMGSVKDKYQELENWFWLSERSVRVAEPNWVRRSVASAVIHLLNRVRTEPDPEFVRKVLENIRKDHDESPIKHGHYAEARTMAIGLLYEWLEPVEG